MSVNMMRSYDQVGRKEDIDDIISNITPTKTPAQSIFGSDSVKNILYQWQEDSLAAAGDNAQVEGAPAPSASMTPTVMRDNTTQILSKTAQTAGTTDATDTYGRDRELALQLANKSAELKRDFEYALVGSVQAKVTGSNTVARKFANYLGQLDGSAVYTVDTTAGALNTAITSQTPGALREDILTKVTSKLYSNGAEPTILMVKPDDSQVIVGFQGVGRTKYIENGDRKLVNVVDVFENSFATLKVVMNRFQLTSAALIFDPSMWKKAVLRNWFRQTLAKTGDSTQVQILGEFGLKHRNYAASGAIINLT